MVIDKLKQENNILKKRIYTLEKYINDLQRNFRDKQTEIINNANQNANIIIAKGINIAYNFKIELEQLWLDLESKQTDPVMVLKLIDNFLEKHQQTFLVNSNRTHQVFQDLEASLQLVKNNS
ncbi:hypothetical protein [Spiroplasma endosymbiont of Eupeodes luniger]|uniref:hypothetical protein n=1 Tax=Spiroplasma endosymbiont of Eupeodes luniger TaxID=3066300 RepID=UPI0030D619A2